MKLNEANVITKNILTDKEIAQIYSSVDLSNKALLVEIHAQNVFDFILEDSTAKKIISYCEEISGVSGLVIEEYQFARYEKTKLGEKTLEPKLTIHSDYFEEPRFTFDYQIGGNTSWPIVVEGKSFELKNNEALSFSGTHQVHWREPKTFNDKEYIDMVFFHLKKHDSEKISMEDREKISIKLNKFLEEFGENING
jgi:hypothetical protein